MAQQPPQYSTYKYSILFPDLQLFPFPCKRMNPSDLKCGDFSTFAIKDAILPIFNRKYGVKGLDFYVQNG